jgi:hypothetical protein
MHTASALDVIRLRPPGSAIWSKESVDRMQTWELSWLVRETSQRIAGLGQSPEIEFRAGLIIEQRIGLVAVVVRVGPESPESVYETWINDHAPGLEDSLELLACQARLTVQLIGDTGQPERVLTVSNQLAGFARDAATEILGLPVWSMPTFDAAREYFCRQHPTVISLWNCLKKRRSDP